MDMKRVVKNAAQMVGIAKLRKPQVKPINDILEGRDTMVVARPSAGKSAIYQIPALVHGEERTIVIEPLLSLMHDQVRKLREHGVGAARLDSTMKKSEQRKCLQKFISGEVQMLFVTPERFHEEEFLCTMKAVAVYMVVVDECHAVLDWGYSFRDAYLNLGQTIDELEARPIITALTATATENDMAEIAQCLHMQNPAMYRNDLYNPKLVYIKQHAVNREEKRKLLCKYLSKYHANSSIVYCNTRKAVEAVYKQLDKKYSGQVTMSHAGLKPKARMANESEFLSGKKTIMVATTAFGMGIDLDSVDLVIHFNMPLSLTDYMQQSGRAGRNGQKAHAVLLYSDEDYYTNLAILHDGHPTLRGMEQLDMMKEFCDDNEHCMAQLLLGHFGQKMKKGCKHCTVCQKNRRKK